jgi:hypothetical protein
MPQLSGGCLCGAIRYRSNGAPPVTVICNCRHCQRQSGTAFSIMVGVPAGALVIEGPEPATFRDTGETGHPVLRHFCGQCGSPLFSQPEATPTMEWIKAGTLDDPSWLDPQMNIWCDSAQPWVQMSDAIPRIGRNPPV